MLGAAEDGFVCHFCMSFLNDPKNMLSGGFRGAVSLKPGTEK